MLADIFVVYQQSQTVFSADSKIDIIKAKNVQLYANTKRENRHMTKSFWKAQMRKHN